jgi:hypothetical protein
LRCMHVPLWLIKMQIEVQSKFVSCMVFLNRKKSVLRRVKGFKKNGLM